MPAEEVLSALSVSVLQVAGPFFMVGMQAAALDTARLIVIHKSTGKLHALPFISLFTSCLIWTYYGLLIKDMSVLVPNALGIMIGLISMGIFQAFGSVTPSTEYTVALCTIGVATFFYASNEALVVGYIGCVMAVIYMGSPLATLSHVFASQSTESMPLSMSVVTFANALSWTLYGYLISNDKLVS